MSPAGRREYVERVRPRYQQASKAVKHVILDEFCAVTGFHRKYAIRLLNGPPKVTRHRRRRPTRYGRVVVEALTAVWTAAGYPWSLRLKALLPDWLPWIRKHLRLPKETESLLLSISPRQMDRCLRDRKVRIRKRMYGRTKPGSLLKHHIPLRTDRWDVTVPGFTEVDLVSHSGDRACGEFIHSLDVTDILTGWTETCALMGASQFQTQGALERIRRDMPFRLLGIDSDNGSEFINDLLARYCKQEEIQFTRGRPYKKDDNAHVEQKNWTHVRRLVGYERYDTPEVLQALNQLYRGDLRRLMNLFMPSVKLLRKERVGSKVRRVYDRPQTPLDRLLAGRDAGDPRVAELVTLRKRLDPFELSASVDRQLQAIHKMATRPGRPAARRLAPPPSHPWKQAFKTMRPAPARVTF